MAARQFAGGAIEIARGLIGPSSGNMFKADYDIRHSARVCAKTGRELKPGDIVYSALTEQGDALVRADYSREGWDGPPPDVVGWWKFRIPLPDSSSAPQLAPRDVLLDLMDQWEREPERRALRYVLALLLIRRRVLRLEGSTTSPDGPETMRLICPRLNREYQVEVAPPRPDEVDDVQNRLEAMLYAGETSAGDA